MVTIPLPQLASTEALKAQLYQDYQIEVPVLEWNGRHFVRVSVQGYNTQSDLDRFVEALTALLPKLTR